MGAGDRVTVLQYNMRARKQHTTAEILIESKMHKCDAVPCVKQAGARMFQLIAWCSLVLTSAELLHPSKDYSKAALSVCGYSILIKHFQYCKWTLHSTGVGLLHIINWQLQFHNFHSTLLEYLPITLSIYFHKIHPLH